MEMKTEQVESYLRSRLPRSEDLKVIEDGDELHLLRGDDRFARLIPTDKEGLWRMEYFHNLEEWRVYDLSGTLEECLDFLTEKHHYLFWE